MAKKSGFMHEFKKFIMRGNVVDLAVGVLIGGAFQAIVKSLVNDIFMPVIGIIIGKIDFSALVFQVGEAKITYGNFISAVLNFLIMAFIIFMLVRTINKVTEKLLPKSEDEEPTTKKCPYCKTEIDKDAVRCPYCTSELE